MKRLLARRRLRAAAQRPLVYTRRGNRIKRGLRRAGLRLMRKATGNVRSTLKQFECEAHLAPF